MVRYARRTDARPCVHRGSNRGRAARAVYWQINPKEIVETTDECYDDGHVMRHHLAKSGPFMVEYVEATTGYAELKFKPLQNR